MGTENLRSTRTVENTRTYLQGKGLNVFMSKAPKMVRIKAELTWAVTQDPESGVYIGICEAVNLNAMGETFADFQQSASDALNLLLTDLFEDDELEQFLVDRGWSTETSLPDPNGVPTFDVPFNLSMVPSLPGRGPAAAVVQ